MRKNDLKQNKYSISEKATQYRLVVAYPIISARLAQLDRAWVLWAQGRGFEPRNEHFVHYNSNAYFLRLYYRQ